MNKSAEGAYLKCYKWRFRKSPGKKTFHRCSSLWKTSCLPRSLNLSSIFPSLWYFFLLLSRCSYRLSYLNLDLDSLNVNTVFKYSCSPNLFLYFLDTVNQYGISFIRDFLTFQIRYYLNAVFNFPDIFELLSYLRIDD